MKHEETYIKTKLSGTFGVLSYQGTMYISTYTQDILDNEISVYALNKEQSQELLNALQEHINHMTP